jgi:lipopolysaccharide biosynthesis glycosyltransferase
MRSVWIGFDPREAAAFAVAAHSARAHLTAPVPIYAVELEDLRQSGLYTRPTLTQDIAGAPPRLLDQISEAPMSTEFAISRFFVPLLARTGWALFMDSDILVRANLARLFEAADPSKAVMCVKHAFNPPPGVKMDGQAQLPYPRKNWSSVMLFNCDHPANKLLTLGMLNGVPGRDLHGFCWLRDEDIGELDPAWNWLVGHSSPEIEPRIVHFTDGFPLMPGYENQPYAEEWREALRAWAGRSRWR